MKEEHFKLLQTNIETMKDTWFQLEQMKQVLDASTVPKVTEYNLIE